MNRELSVCLSVCRNDVHNMFLEFANKVPLYHYISSELCCKINSEMQALNQGVYKTWGAQSMILA